MPLARLTLIACALGMAGSAAPISREPAAARFTYERHDLVLGSATRQTVVAGSFLGGAVADLAVVHLDPSGERRLRIYALGAGGWAPRLDATLDPTVLFVDLATIGGRDRLITYAPGRLSWFDPVAPAEHPLVAVTSSFDPPRRGEIPHVDVTRDVNGDGADDLVVPDADGFWVLVQTGDGTFAGAVKVGSAADLSGIYGADGYRYAPWGESRVHPVDWDGDGLQDLVFWNEDHFEVHYQDERRRFAPQAGTTNTGVVFDSDDPYSLAAGEMTGRVLHSVADMNGDGIADLVVYSLAGTSLRGKRSAYEVHLGARAPDGGTGFTPHADRAFRSEDKIQLAMERYDFDRDGEGDLMLTTIERELLVASPWKRIKGFMGDDVRLELEFYRGEGGRYADTPDAVRTIALDGVPSHREPGSVPLEIVLRGATHERRQTQRTWPRAFNPTLLVGDVTGDGLSDLLLGDHPRQLRVFVGVPGSDLFSRQPQAVAIDVPNDEEYVWLVDLDRDGRLDVLMHHPFTSRDAHGAPQLPPGTEPQRVTMLIAR